jgi:hypothetical protein
VVFRMCGRGRKSALGVLRTLQRLPDAPTVLKGESSIALTSVFPLNC